MTTTTTARRIVVEASIGSMAPLVRVALLLGVSACVASAGSIFGMTSTSGGSAATTTTTGTNNNALPRRMASAGRGGMPVAGGVGFDKERTLGFVEYLSADALESIDTFDRLSVGLNMTIENFFTFINRLLEEEVPEEDEAAADEEEANPWEDEDTLTVKQLGQLFGGVNDTAVEYILNTLNADIYDLQAGFNTVDVIMVLMFVSSHLEANRMPMSILEIISGFCDPEWEELDAAVWVKNVAKAKGVREREVHKVMEQLEGSLEDIRGYVEEIVRMDTCELILNGGFPTAVSAATKASPRLGGIRGQATSSAYGAAGGVMMAMDKRGY